VTIPEPPFSGFRKEKEGANQKILIDFDLLKRFCYDAVNFGFSLNPFPWIKTQVVSPKGEKECGVIN
jgi:hypothetical protein